MCEEDVKYSLCCLSDCDKGKIYNSNSTNSIDTCKDSDLDNFYKNHIFIRTLSERALTTCSGMFSYLSVADFFAGHYLLNEQNADMCDAIIDLYLGVMIKIFKNRLNIYMNDHGFICAFYNKFVSVFLKSPKLNRFFIGKYNSFSTSQLEYCIDDFISRNKAILFSNLEDDIQKVMTEYIEFCRNDFVNNVEKCRNLGYCNENNKVEILYLSYDEGDYDILLDCPFCGNTFYHGKIERNGINILDIVEERCPKCHESYYVIFKEEERPMYDVEKMINSPVTGVIKLF